MIALRRIVRRTYRRIAKPARLFFNDWLSRQADGEIERMRDAQAAASKLEQKHHRRKVDLSINRNAIEKGLK